MTLNKPRRPDFVVTVDVIVKCKEEVLFIRRAKDPFKGKLALPGGHVEQTDDSLRDACVRELEEETGIKVRREQLRLRTILDGPGRDPRYANSISVVFMVELNSWPDSIIACDDGVESIVICDVNILDGSELAFDHIKAVELVMWKDQTL